MRRIKNMFSQLGLNETSSATEDSLTSILYITRYQVLKASSHKYMIYITRYLVHRNKWSRKIGSNWSLTDIRVGVKDVGRYRCSSNIFTRLQISFKSWVLFNYLYTKLCKWFKFGNLFKYLFTKLWNWFRCVELDYSQDQINIDSDYGEEWRVEETETNGDEGKFNFMIGLPRKQIKLKPSKRAKLILWFSGFWQTHIVNRVK